MVNVSVLLIVLVFSGFLYYVPATANKTLKYTWFECGLLGKYTVPDFVAVLTFFEFDGVMVQPFLLDENQKQTRVYSDLNLLLIAIPEDIQVFLFVGMHEYLDYDLAQEYAGGNYVLCIDDGVENQTLFYSHISFLNNLGVEVGVVHWKLEPAYKMYIESGLIDYLFMSFYPYAPFGEFNMFVRDLQIMRGYCGDTCKFIPTLQLFGGAAQNWRFPNMTELNQSLTFFATLNPHAVLWFEPWTGESLRGEDFDGFLDHPEVWELIT